MPEPLPLARFAAEDDLRAAIALWLSWLAGERRSSVLPDLPTMTETAIPGFEASTWWGILAPAGTPAAVVSDINDKLARALAQGEVTDRFAALGADPVGGPPQRLAEHLQSEIPKWRKVIRAANIRM